MAMAVLQGLGDLGWTDAGSQCPEGRWSPAGLGSANDQLAAGPAVENGYVDLKPGLLLVVPK